MKKKYKVWCKTCGVDIGNIEKEETDYIKKHMHPDLPKHLGHTIDYRELKVDTD